jgi:hypothetical protein
VVMRVVPQCEVHAHVIGRRKKMYRRALSPSIYFCMPNLVSTEWESKYPMVTVNALPRTILDHTLMLLNTGMSSQHTLHLFKFELGWLLKDGFYDMVIEIWQKERKGSTPMEIWQNKIRSLRRYHRRWAKNQNGAYKKEKKISQVK